jgi:adenylate cyclase
MSKPVILCVDDEEMILISLKDQLKDHFSKEYSIEMVASGDEALELFTELIAETVDVPLLICDQIMPGMKGHELLSEIHLLSPRTLKILLTGQADAFAVGEAVNNANLYRYIAKPWEETDLVMTIKEAVRSFYQDRKLEEQNLALKEMNENLEDRVIARTTEVVQQKEKIQDQLNSIEKQHNDLELRNEFIRNIFGRYVTDEIMVTLLENPEGLKFGGEKREVTILMSDIRGFTSMSERYTPEKIVAILNHYLGKMVDIIIKHNGIVIEFLGDGILVVFGAPNKLENHAAAGIACALEMQLAMDEVNEFNTKHSFPAMEMGIGINTGEVVVGNIGSDKRAKYGIVGMAVNVASRLEGLTVGGQVLISPTTKASCHCDVRVSNEFMVGFKGVEEDISIYDITAIKNDQEIYLERPQDMLTDIPNEVLLDVWIIDGKSLSDNRIRAKLLKLSNRSALIACDYSIDPFSNLKLLWTYQKDSNIRAEMYAKVVEVKSGIHTIRFTSLSPEAEQYIYSITRN